MLQCRHLFACSLLLLTIFYLSEARYLPTRSQDDRLDQLRDLLKDLLESEVEKPGMNNYERRLMFKRDIDLSRQGEAAEMRHALQRT